MAKTQNLSLNPTKISGTCGRLMCCLKYEQNAYEDAVKRMPKNDSFVDTPDGIGNVSSIDLLREEVQVRLDSAPESPKKFKNCEVRVLRNGKGSRDGIEIPKDRPARFVAPTAAEDRSSTMHRLPREPIAIPSVIAAEEDEEQRREGSRRRRGGRRGDKQVRAEKVVKAEHQRAPKAAPKQEKAETAEKLPVRSASNTTAEKKAAADRAARAQAAGEKAAAEKTGEQRKKFHHRHRRHRPRGKGGSAQGE